MIRTPGEERGAVGLVGSYQKPTPQGAVHERRARVLLISLNGKGVRRARCYGR